MILYLPFWITAPDRKSRISRFLEQAPVRGLIAVAFNEGGVDDVSCTFIKTLWKYDKAIESPQTAAVADEVNRCIDDAYETHEIDYGGATVIIRAMPSANQ